MSIATVFGIDPGLKGAVAIIDPVMLTLEAFNPPTLQRKVGRSMKSELNTAALADVFLSLSLRKAHGMIEYVWAREGQGVTSMFNFGVGYGEYLGMMAASKVAYQRITPREWKSEMRMSSDKEESRQRASETMPGCSYLWRFKYQEGIAEAAMMALFLIPAANRLSIASRLKPIVADLKAA